VHDKQIQDLQIVWGQIFIISLLKAKKYSGTHIQKCAAIPFFSWWEKRACGVNQAKKFLKYLCD